jgi:hypothetical protein
MDDTLKYEDWRKDRDEQIAKAGACVGCGHTAGQHWNTGPNEALTFSGCAECRCAMFRFKA